MPWSKTTDHDECDGIAVVKDSTGEVEGCHETEQEADDQLAALNASGGYSASDGGRALSDIDLSPPSAMVNAAQMGLTKKKELDLGDCGTGAGETSARMIVNGEVTPARVREIAAYLRSHEEDYTPSGTPSTLSDEQLQDGCGTIQYLLWGGGTDTAYNWALRKANRVAEEQGDSKPYSESDFRSMTRADVDELSEGDLVAWDSAGGTAYGEIDTIAMGETVSGSLEPEDTEHETSEDDPGIIIELVDKNDEGEIEGEGDTVFHRPGTLTKIEEGDIPERSAQRMAVPEGPFAANVTSSESGESGFYYPIYRDPEEAEAASFTGEMHAHQFEEIGSEVYMPDEPMIHAADSPPEGLPVVMVGGEEMSASPSARNYEGRTYQSRINDPEIRTTADGKVTVMVATDQIARDGMVLDPSGIDTRAYERNPVILWEHGSHPNGGSVPIGRAVDLKEKEGGYLAEVEFDEGDEFASEIKRKVENGYINAVSIGWRTEDVSHEKRGEETVPVVREADMTEFSFVGVPADTDALVQSRMHYDEEGEEMWPTHRSVIKGRLLEEACRRAMGSEMTVEQAKKAVKMEMDERLMGGREAALGPSCPFGDTTEQFGTLAEILSADAEILRMSAASEGCMYDMEASDTDSETRDETTARDDCGCEGTPSSPSASGGTPPGAERDESPGKKEVLTRLLKEVGPQKIRKIREQKARDRAMREAGLK
jgi:HK97 family phage prohead protease